ncbi:MAG: MFS transporter [Deltaproteobacteria bacterium]|nr:MAG: MFS transporter [Deltaproteobacteria bacterium]
MKSQITPWQVLQQRDFGLFWLSLLFSAVGSQISTVAVAWQVYEITNSPFQLGLTGLFRALPVMILSLPGGVLADRMDRRKLLIITQSLAALLAVALGLLTSTGEIRVWHIYAVTFLSGAVGIFDAPARTAMIPALVSAEQLASAYALNITWRQIATLGGPFIGGVVISVLGISPAYYIDAGSFLAVIICLAFMRRQVKPAREQKESPIQSVRAGFTFIRENSVILGLMSMDTCVQFFGAYRSMMPAFARDILGTGPAGLGALLGVPALGALAGSGMILAAGNPRRKGRLIIGVTLLYTIGLVCFALSRSLTLSLLIVFCLGLVDAVGETVRDTLVQLTTPDRMRGRVKSFDQVFMSAGTYMGHAQIGAAASFIGVPGALILGGCLGSAAVLLVAKFARRLRNIDT